RTSSSRRPTASEIAFRRSGIGVRLVVAWSSVPHSLRPLLSRECAKGKTVPCTSRRGSCSGFHATLSFRVRRAIRAAFPAPRSMLINLLPDFLAVVESTDRLAAYHRYFAAHRALLEQYWHNYVIDPEGPHFTDIVRSAVDANRSDLRAMLDRVDV